MVNSSVKQLRLPGFVNGPMYQPNQANSDSIKAIVWGYLFSHFPKKFLSKLHSSLQYYVWAINENNTIRPCTQPFIQLHWIDAKGTHCHWNGIPQTFMIQTQQIRDISTMLVYSWANVCDADPTINQHCANVSCLLGMISEQ